MEDIEQSQISDASTPESSSEAPQAEQNQAGGAQPQANEKQTDLPFHEHPRWKEVINERNQLTSKLQEMERRFEEFSRQREQPQAQQSAPQQNKLIERLKGIDPEFATWAEQQEALKSQMSQVIEDLQQRRTETEQARIAQTVEQLHTQNKVPTEMQSLYQAQLKEMAAANPRLGFKDLPQMYKSVHDSMQKFLDSYKRQALAEYSKGKASDSVPSAPKGQVSRPASSQKKSSGPTDPEAERDALVKQVAQNLRAQRNA